MRGPSTARWLLFISASDITRGLKKQASAFLRSGSSVLLASDWKKETTSSFSVENLA